MVHSHQCSCSDEIPNVEQASEGMCYMMNKQIDLDKVVVLNESIEGSGVKIFKDWENRKDKTVFVNSDVDEELLFNLPFRGNVKITGIVLIGDLDATHPSIMKVFKDRPSMSFEDANCRSEQEFLLKQDSEGVVDYALKATKFSSLAHLSLHFPKNFGAERTRIYYIGLRGQYVSEFRRQIAIATYEARPMLQDHKGEMPSEFVGRNIIT